MSFFKEKPSKHKFFVGPIEAKLSSIPDIGLGVFATKEIKKYDLIEKCPVILFDRWILRHYYDQRDHNHIIADYIFQWPGGQNVAIALGNGSLYNHSDEPNAVWKYTVKDRNLIYGGFCEAGIHDSIDFYAKKDISAGEEIFTNYGSKSEFGLSAFEVNQIDDWYNRNLR